MKYTPAVVAILLLVGLLSFSVGASEFYVSPGGDDSATGTKDRPFASIERARDAIRDLKTRTGLREPITVYLSGGIYRLTGPVLFTPDDSGSDTCPITYTALPGERPVLSGGRRITGWRVDDQGRWVVDLPEVAAGRWFFRQLYAGGESRPRARTPNEGFLRVAGFPEGTIRTVHYHTDCKSFEFAPGDIRPDWTNLLDVEVIVYHFWTDSHLPIRMVDTKTNIVTFAHKAGKVFTDDFTTDGARYVVTNLLEGIDSPGEWYLDRRTGRLYYLPLEGEDPSTLEVIAPSAPAHLRLKGNAAKRQFVEHVHFENLALEYTHFQLPVGNSNDRQGSASIPAAISFEGARHCSIEHCLVNNLGTSAVQIGPGCREIRIAGNRMSNIAASAVRVDGGTEREHPLLRTAGNRVVDNDIGPYGVEYPSAVGVLLMNTSGNSVAHNDIHHGFYTGVSAGWVWGYGRSVARDNRIEFNHIHHIGQGLLSDMGGVYTLGVSPGTVIANNHIHNVDANHYGGWGIYNDEGSSHIRIENNVVHDTKFAGYNIHYAKEVTVNNNIFAFGLLEQVSRGRAEPHKSCFFEGNIVYWTTGELFSKNWKDEPYEFYFQPNKGGGSGVRTVDKSFDVDWNVYFNPDVEPDEVEFNGLSLGEWRKAGRDRNSVWADPMFVDAPNRDLRLKPDSPALTLGFTPIDLTTTGPRQPAGPQR